jgi:hypothetical protein
MLPVYNLVVDITSTEKNLEEMLFREQVAPCLAYLEALKGSFDLVPCKTTYYSPFAQNNTSEYWSLRTVVILSVGKQRAEYLIQLYKAVVRLIEFELPDFEVQAEINQMNFS